MHGSMLYSLQQVAQRAHRCCRASTLILSCQHDGHRAPVLSPCPSCSASVFSNDLQGDKRVIALYCKVHIAVATC